MIGAASAAAGLSLISVLDAASIYQFAALSPSRAFPLPCRACAEAPGFGVAKSRSGGSPVLNFAKTLSSLSMGLSCDGEQFQQSRGMSLALLQCRDCGA